MGWGFHQPVLFPSPREREQQKVGAEPLVGCRRAAPAGKDGQRVLGHLLSFTGMQHGSKRAAPLVCRAPNTVLLQAPAEKGASRCSGVSQDSAAAAKKKNQGKKRRKKKLHNSFSRE